MTLSMALGQIMSSVRMLLGIPCVIDWNIQRVDTFSVLVNKYANISPVGKFFSDKSLF